MHVRMMEVWRLVGQRVRPARPVHDESGAAKGHPWTSSVQNTSSNAAHHRQLAFIAKDAST